LSRGFFCRVHDDMHRLKRKYSNLVHAGNEKEALQSTRCTYPVSCLFLHPIPYHAIRETFYGKSIPAALHDSLIGAMSTC
jgi:hypothetical protein